MWTTVLWALMELRKLNSPQHPLNLGLHFNENPARAVLAGDDYYEG